MTTCPARREPPLPLGSRPLAMRWRSSRPGHFLTELRLQFRRVRIRMRRARAGRAWSTMAESNHVLLSHRRFTRLVRGRHRVRRRARPPGTPRPNAVDKNRLPDEGRESWVLLRSSARKEIRVEPHARTPRRYFKHRLVGRRRIAGRIADPCGVTGEQHDRPVPHETLAVALSWTIGRGSCLTQHLRQDRYLCRMRVMPRPSLSYAATAVLQAVSNGHQYGFDVIAVTGLASGTVYPALRRLEEAGWLESRWEEHLVAQRELRPPRKYYEVTIPGGVALATALERYRALARPGRAPHRPLRPSRT